MLQPKRTKFRKRSRAASTAWRKGGTELNFGAYGMKALEPGRVTARADRGGAPRHHPPPQARRPRLDPHLPGRAGVARSRPRSAWARARARSSSGSPGSSPAAIMFEIDGVPEDLASEAIRLGAAKLPIGTQVHQAPAGRRGGGVMKAVEVRRKTRRPAERAARPAEEGAVQPALPEGDRAARGYRPRAAGAARHRPRPDHPGRAREGRGRELEERDDAEAHPARDGRQRQERQDGGRVGRAARHAPYLQEVHPALEEVPRARRRQPVQGRRRGADPRVPADLEAQDLEGWSRIGDARSTCARWRGTRPVSRRRAGCSAGSRR